MEARDVEALRRSCRICHASERYRFLISKRNVLIIDYDEPTCFEDVPTDVDSFKWMNPWNLKWISCTTRRSGHLVDLCKGIKLIGYKWVFNQKTDKEGQIVTYKVGW